MTKPKNDAYAICTAQKKKSGMGHDAWKRCVKQVKNEDSMMKFSERVKELLEKAMSDDQIERDQADREEDDEKAEDEEEAKTGQAEGADARTPEQNRAIDKKLLAAKEAAEKRREIERQKSQIMKKESTGKDKDPVGTEAWKDFWKDKETEGEKKKKNVKSEAMTGKGATAAERAVDRVRADKDRKERRAAAIKQQDPTPRPLRRQGENIDPDTGEPTRASKKTLAAILRDRKKKAAEKAEGEPQKMKTTSMKESHPSSSQSRLKKELGDEAYKKLSSRPNDPSPVAAAKAKKKKAKLPTDDAAQMGMSLSIRKKDEGVQKQARIKLDKEKTAVGATASNQSDDPRRSPSLSTSHNSPEGQARRKATLKKSRVNRGRAKAWKWAQKQSGMGEGAEEKYKTPKKPKKPLEVAKITPNPHIVKKKTENIDDPREPSSYSRGSDKAKEIGKAKSIHPSKRTPEQQKNYERLRKKYQDARSSMNNPPKKTT